MLLLMSLMMTMKMLMMMTSDSAWTSASEVAGQHHLSLHIKNKITFYNRLLSTYSSML